MLSKRILLFILFSFFLIKTAGAQEVYITGYVMDSTQKVPVDLATIVVRSSGDVVVAQTLSLENGLFSLKVPRQANLVLLITKVNYKSKQIELFLQNKDSLSIGTIYLALESKMLDQVTITGTRSYLKNSLDKLEYEVEKDTSMQKKTVSDAVGKMPFVVVTPDGDIKYKNDKKILFLVNGNRYGSVSNTPSTTLRGIPANLIKSIELQTVPAQKYLQQGYDVVINIITKPGYLRGVIGNVQISYDTRNNTNDKLFLMGPKNDLVVQVNLLTNSTGNRNYIDQVLRSSQPSGTLSQDIGQAIKYRHNNYLGEVSLLYNFPKAVTASVYTNIGNRTTDRSMSSSGKIDLGNGAYSIQYNTASDHKHTPWEIGGEINKKLNKAGEVNFLFKYTNSNVNEIQSSQAENAISTYKRNFNDWLNHDLNLQLSLVKTLKNGITLDAGVLSLFRSFNSNNQTDSSSDGVAWISIVDNRNNHYNQHILSPYSSIRISA